MEYYNHLTVEDTPRIGGFRECFEKQRSEKSDNENKLQYKETKIKHTGLLRFFKKKDLAGSKKGFIFAHVS
jgi:hypothetical protein